MHYDVIVLGAGSAGLTASAGAAALGKKTLLIEKEKMGGDCTWYGCVPSKALLHASRIAHAIRSAPGVGLPEVQGYPTRVEYGPILEHIHAIQQGIYEHETPEAWEKLGVEVRIGEARFRGPGTLEMQGESLTADRFILATGSRSVAPPIPGLHEAGFLDHKDIFTMESAPESLVVIGGGPIGCEMSQAFARFGVQVTLVELAPSILIREDPEAARVVEQALVDDGVTVHTNAKTAGVRVEDGTKVLSLEVEGEKLEVRAGDILVSTGRAPNIEGLGLEDAGVRVNKRGVEVDDQLRSVTNSKVYACGDVAGRYLFTHTAEYEARHIVTGLALDRPVLSLLSPLLASPRYRPVGWTTFTDPELARVGLTEAEAREEGRKVQIYTLPFSKVDRAICEGRTEGFVKVVTTPWRGKILGVTIVGPHAGELLHEWVLAMHQNIPLRKLASAIHVYPTLARSARKAADLYLREFLMGQLARLKGGKGKTAKQEKANP